MRKRGTPYNNPAKDAYAPDDGLKNNSVAVSGGKNNRRQQKTLSGPVKPPRGALTMDEYTHGRSADWKPADSADRVAKASEDGNYIDY